MSDLFWLTDAEMLHLKLLFPNFYTELRVDDKRVLSGIIFINHNGLRWQDDEPCRAIDGVDGSRFRHRNVPCRVL